MPLSKQRVLEMWVMEAQLSHVLRTRAPCAIPYCYGTRTRLACVKHAASVRSEPGSNSRLNLVAWRKKSRDLHPRQPAKRIVDRSNLLRPLALENSNGFEQILAHRIGCQRARPPCPAERQIYNPRSMPRAGRKVNTRLNDFHSDPQWGAHCLHRGRMRAKRDKSDS